MEPLNQQVRKARRRLVLQQFWNRFVWCLFAAMMISVVAIGVTKFVPVGVASDVWGLSWFAGALGGALVGAAFLTYLTRQSELDAAIEIDRRFELKERVSSTLALGPDDRQTEAGRALIADTVRRVERIDVATQFRLTTGRRAWLPLIPVVIAAGLLLLPDASGNQQAAAADEKDRVRKQLENSTQALRRKIAKRRAQAEKKNLKDAAALFEKVETGLKRANKSKRSDRKKAIIELNNLASELKQRRTQLQGAEQLRQQFGKMQEIGKGPADKIGAAIKKGDVKAALDQIKKLQNQLATNSLTPEEQEELAKQFGKIAEQLKQAADAQQQARAQLENEIDKLRAAGDLAEAERKQQQLDQLDQLDRQNRNSDRMKQLADKLAKCAECAGDGKSGEASQQLAGLSDQLSEMQQQLEEVEMLDEALEQFAQAKGSMTCQECNGAGCSACQGEGVGTMPGSDGKSGRSRSFARGSGQGKGLGNGKGQGEGDRPIDEDPFGTFDTNVSSNVRRGGKSVVIGEAGGPNVKGPVLEELKRTFTSGDREEADAIKDRRLPRSQQDQARQYFDLLREEEE